VRSKCDLSYEPADGECLIFEDAYEIGYRNAINTVKTIAAVKNRNIDIQLLDMLALPDAMEAELRDSKHKYLDDIQD